MFKSKHCKHNISTFPVAINGGTGSFVNNTSTVIVCGGQTSDGHSNKCYYFTHMDWSNLTTMNRSPYMASSEVKGSNLWITGGLDGVYQNVRFYNLNSLNHHLFVYDLPPPNHDQNLSRYLCLGDRTDIH